MDSISILLIALLIIIGTVCLFLSLGLSRTRSQWRRRMFSDPTRPWRADGQWNSGFEFPAAEDAKAINIAWLVGSGNALLAAGLLWIAYVEALPEGLKVAFDAYALAILAAFGVAIYREASFRRYGLAKLVLDEVPVVPGRSLVGAVRCARPVPAIGPFRVSLKCVKVTKDDEFGSTVLFECTHAQPVSVEGGRGGTLVPLSIPIPRGLPSATAQGEMPTIYWRLTVSANTAGLGFEAIFDLPVFCVENEGLIERGPAAG